MNTEPSRRSRLRLSLRTIAVSGDSMSPTYNPGDWLLFRCVRYSNNLSINRAINLVGKVVIFERDQMPGILHIKRVLRIEDSAFWVEGDNKEFSTDSRHWGIVRPHEMRGVVLLRYKAEQ